MSLEAGWIPPGEWLGLLGGGQLGRMFTMAAQSLGYRVCVLDPGDHSPAGSVADRHLRADYLDHEALQELARSCRGVTTEFENVPAAAMAFLARHCRVTPSADAVAIAQDRMREKRFVQSCGIATAPYCEVHNVEDLAQASDALFPGILKVSRLGYDGKGQAPVADRNEAERAFDAFKRVPCVLEQRLALERELSVVAARRDCGEVVTFSVAENEHASGILARSIAPGHIARSVAERATHATLAIADRFNYVGVLCVEFFLIRDEHELVSTDPELVVNEIAPRPHNSGHYTIDACVTSQFEQQARILAGLPLGSTEQHSAAVMLNLLGDLWREAPPDWRTVLAHPRVKLHLYGKREARAGRKMGHVTCLGEDIDAALATAHAIRDMLSF